MTRGSLLECEQTWNMPSLNRNLKCDYVIRLSLLFLSVTIKWACRGVRKHMGQSHGLMSSDFRICSLHPHLLSLPQKPLALGSCLMQWHKVFMPPDIFVPAVSFAQRSLHTEYLERAPPVRSLSNLFHFPCPGPLYPPSNCLSTRDPLDFPVSEHLPH